MFWLVRLPIQSNNYYITEYYIVNYEMIMNTKNKITYLNAWFSQVNAQPISITTVVIYEFL